MSYSFSPDHANPNYDPNYNNSMSVTEEDEIKALKREFEDRAAASGKRKRRPLLSKEKIADAAREMEDESSLDQSRKPCRGLFCGLFSGGKRRTKKRRKKRRTKSRRKTKRRRKSRRRTKRRRRKR